MPALVNPSSARDMLNSGIVEPTAANAATKETTANMNVSRSVLSWLGAALAGAVLCIEPRLLLVMDRSWAPVWFCPSARMSWDEEPAAADQEPGAIAHAETQSQVPARFWYT